MTGQDVDADKFYTTNKAHIAAWLWSQGFKPVNFVITQYPGLIIFENSDALQKCTHLWEIEEAKGDCNAFFDYYRKVLDRLKASRLYR